MKNYKFTQSWFGAFGYENLNSSLPIGTQKEHHILEIGSYEGMSTVWFLENLCQNPSSTITCIDPWMNYIQDSNSFNTYSPETETFSGVDYTEGKVYERFLHNTTETGYGEKVKTIKGLSYEELPKLMNQQKLYDVIYIDGNHTAPFVLTDALMSWYLLKPKGKIIFDDYEWDLYKEGATLTPKLAIDSFIKVFSDYCEVLYEGEGRKAIIKLI